MWINLTYIKKKIIEIGCGTGPMLDIFKKAGLVSLGLEWNSNSIKYARRNELAKKMREKRGDELKEKQREYAKIHRDKRKKEIEDAMAAIL